MTTWGRPVTDTMSALVLASCLAIAAPVPAAAQQVHAFNVSAPDPASAIRTFGVQAGIQILASADDLRGRELNPVSGHMSTERALNDLLAGTGLEHRYVSDRAVALVRNSPESGDSSKRLPSSDTTATVPEKDPSHPGLVAQADEKSSSKALDGDQQTIRGAEKPAQLAEVVVTAQKREESLQSTPVAISVLSAADLANKGISGLPGLGSGAVPSLRWTTFGGRSSAFVIGMRGLVPGDATQISRDNVVGLYVDGVYLGRVQGLGADLLDVERIEVLRGPQGTLFGRNALAGAVSIATKAPTGELGGRFTAGVRNFNGFDVNGTVNLPAVAGISVKFDGSWSKRDGWLDNPDPGQRGWGAYDRRGGRITALWKPTGNFSARYSFEKSRDETTPTYVQIDSLLPGAPPIAPFFSVEPQRATRARGGFTNEPSVGDVEGHTAILSWDISDHLEARSISAYRTMTQSQFENYAGTFFPYVPGGLFARLSLAEIHQRQSSEEIQLVGSNDRLKYVVGAIYFDESGGDSAYTPLGARFNADGSGYVNLETPVGGPPPKRASKASTKSNGLFGQLIWTPALWEDRLHLTGGLRYTDDHKTGELTFRSGVPLTGITFDFESHRVDPAGIVAFDLTPDLKTYLSWGRAYRAGGANSRSPRFLAFGPEVGSTWELGLKSQFLSDRGRFNLALWKSRYHDMQIEFVSPIDPAVYETANAHRPADFKGVEAELTILPLPDLSITASYTYTDASIPPQPSPFGGTEVVTLPVVNTPKHAAALSLEYGITRSQYADVTLHTDLTYSGKVYVSEAAPRQTSGYTLVNMRLSFDELMFQGDSHKPSLSVWVKNLMDRQYITGDFEPIAGPGLSNFMISYYNEPRTYGLDLTYRF